MAAAAFPPYHQHPSVWVVAVLLEGGYLWALRAAARHPEERASRRQLAAWTVGVATLFVASFWPLHDLAEQYLYSAHMVQHMLMSLVAPPLLLAGTPPWLARRILSPRPLFATVRFVSRPLVAFVLFNAYLVFGHWTSVVDFSLRSEPGHFGLHTVLVLTSLAMWMPVLSPLPEIPRLGPPAQMLYLFAQSIVPTVPASFLTLSDGVIYRAYATFPRLWGLSAIEDQRIAGLIMKLAGGLILWGFIAAIFFRWAFREQEADRRALRRGVVRQPSDDTVLTWEQVEAELSRLGPAPKEPPAR
ncbi:MAG: hypothetical protein C4344_02175 [Acidimicrobiia bacterium]